MENRSFIKFWTALFVRPEAFFKKYLADSSQQPAFFNLAILIFGVGAGIDRLDKRFIKYDLKGDLESISSLNNWFKYWLIATIGGLIGGYIYYYIGGWFFNVRLKWSKGTSDIDKSRYINLYGGVVANAVIVLVTVISMFFDEKPYDPESDFHVWDLISIILGLFFVYYSVYVSYCGVRTITDANELRSKIWFLLVPIALYSLGYISVFLMIFNHFL